MYQKSSTTSSTSSNREEGNEASQTSSKSDIGRKCGILERLLGSNIDFTELEQPMKSSQELYECFDAEKIKENIEKVQGKLFRCPTFIEDKTDRLRKERADIEKEQLKEKALEEEEKAKEAACRATAFQFDFGYLDAEVYDLVKELDRVYPDVCPMPDTSTTNSIYSSTKNNLDKLGLKVVLNRICIVGRYALAEAVGTTLSVSHSSTYSDVDKEADDDEVDIVMEFVQELRRIRLRADSIFAKELGPITGCLLSYPSSFVLMMEGPEISIMDVFTQGRNLFFNAMSDGCVLFLAGHVLIRYLKDWVDLIIQPPPDLKPYPKVDDDAEAVKEQIIILTETLKKLWREVALAKLKGVSPDCNVSPSTLPEVGILNFVISCGLLREFDTWLRRLLRLTFGDMVGDSWPQLWSFIPATIHKTDTQFDSLGVLDTFEDIPGLDESLEEFLNQKKAWTPKRNVTNDSEAVTNIWRKKLIKQGSIMSLLSDISKVTAYQT